MPGTRYPSDVANFNYVNMSMNPVTTSTSTLPNINANSGTISTVSNYTQDKMGILWNLSSSNFDRTNKKFSIRSNSSGIIESTASFNMSAFDCDINYTVGITYCNGLFYGACSPVSSQGIRLFSFNSTGNLQSAVTKSSSYTRVRGLACYGQNSLLLANDDKFYKYDLNFNLLASDSSNVYDFGSDFGYISIAGITTDGEYLYIQRGSQNSNPPYNFIIAKATLGSLK